ncbi:Inositol 2-dehydrogenase/D-chiro-inositol 3-dehydrogenase [Limihaloglobus sulfuriphilus]|uniref:Inositol 2-dehydrogenase/D-chiro-inositol 3-dehydrogenase n=1 Tax=Limihaloglobus sulfuriphilus TaxID=1851148 RepID=A0A1Q2MCV6_9BACT|nr:Gfo/Idh/MocA family oxidoreductase [Limihaloglobus sulfuriphilus]AQQ70536.1 Inositol 2-dehydrogenase/D-chiro-inositol 3-dehydrogenase [Limihaloglobus sulfuriphilus]
MNNIKIGIIGCGLRIRQVAHGLMKHTNRVEVVALNDISEQSIEQTCEYLDIKPKVYASYEKLVSNPEIDWVLVGSWNSFHLEHVLSAFENNKNVFCEKPLATDLEGCIKIYQAWRTTDKQFMIGFTLRYSPHYMRIKETLDSGLIGSIVSFEFNETLDFNHGGYIMGGWRSLIKNSGTHLLEKCCHDIDIANWLSNSRPARVASFGGLNIFKPCNEHWIEKLGVNTEGKKAFYAWGQPNNPFLNEKDIIDNQVTIMEFENGVRSTFHTNCSSAIPERRIYILGEEGAIRADAITGKIEVRRIGFDEQFKDISTSVKGSHAGGDDFLCKSLSEAVLNLKESPTGMSDALISAATCFGVDKAMDDGVVYDMNPVWQKVDRVLNQAE